MYTAYCTGKGRSRPHCRCRAWTACGTCPITQDGRRRVARQQLDQQEDQHRDQERHGHGLPDAPERVAQQGHGAGRVYSPTVTFLKSQGPVAIWTNPFIFLLMAMV